MPAKKNRPSISAKSKKRKPAPPTKPKNSAVRKREYLTPNEVFKLRDAAKAIGRHGNRDYWLITLMYRHGLRVSEVIDLRWHQVDFNRASLHVTRLKNGDPCIQPIEGDELRALRKLKRENEDSDFIFTTERQGPLAPRTVHTIVARAGELAGITFPVHPHQLRHARGFRLAATGSDTRAIQAYLGHRNIQHTVLYTKLNPARFKGFAKD